MTQHRGSSPGTASRVWVAMPMTGRCGTDGPPVRSNHDQRRATLGERQREETNHRDTEAQRRPNTKKPEDTSPFRTTDRFWNYFLSSWSFVFSVPRCLCG